MRKSVRLIAHAVENFEHTIAPSAGPAPMSHLYFIFLITIYSIIVIARYKFMSDSKDPILVATVDGGVVFSRGNQFCKLLEM